MARRISIGAAAAAAIALMVSALWVWQQGPHWAFDAERPDLTLWSARSAAAAIAALAQGIVLTLVLGKLYRTQAVDLLLRFLAVIVLAIAGAGAITLELAGR